MIAAEVTTGSRHPWQSRAACGSALDPHLFFDALRVREAQQFCHICPVLLDCMRNSVGETGGTWAGVWRPDVQQEVAA